MIKCKKFPKLADWLRNYGWIPEWPKGTDCKSAGTAFEGSNPSPPIWWIIFIIYEYNSYRWRGVEQLGSSSNPSPPILHNTGLQAVKCNLGCTKFGLCIKIYQRAGVAELADAQDLKSCGTYTPIRVRFPLPALSLIWLYKYV